MEKSCGAVIFRREGAELLYLLIRSGRTGNWGFPKGHVEPGETEEQTALREVYEETGYRVRVLPGFRELVSYPLDTGNVKEVVYFAAEALGDADALDQDEVAECLWLARQPAEERLTFYSAKQVLRAAAEFLSDELA